MQEIESTLILLFEYSSFRSVQRIGISPFHWLPTTKYHQVRKTCNYNIEKESFSFISIGYLATTIVNSPCPFFSRRILDIYVGNAISFVCAKKINCNKRIRPDTFTRKKKKIKLSILCFLQLYCILPLSFQIAKNTLRIT